MDIVRQNREIGTPHPLIEALQGVVWLSEFPTVELSADRRNWFFRGSSRIGQSASLVPAAGYVAGLQGEVAQGTLDLTSLTFEAPAPGT